MTQRRRRPHCDLILPCNALRQRLNVEGIKDDDPVASLDSKVKWIRFSRRVCVWWWPYLRLALYTSHFPFLSGRREEEVRFRQAVAVARREQVVAAAVPVILILPIYRSAQHSFQGYWVGSYHRHLATSFSHSFQLHIRTHNVVLSFLFFSFLFFFSQPDCRWR